MSRDERTEYQLTLCPDLNPTRSLGRSKLINSESLIDQIGTNERSTHRPGTQESPIKRPANEFSTQSNSFLVSQETGEQKPRPSRYLPSK